MEFGWRDPYQVALGLRGAAEMVLLESAPGYGQLGTRSLLAVEPAEVLTAGSTDLQRVGSGELWAGWLSYDLGRQFESLPDGALDDRGLPPLALGRYESWLEFDHSAKTVRLLGDGRGSRMLRRAAQAPSEAPPDHVPASEWSSSLPRTAYEQAVREAIDYIRAGDVFQVNLSQRLTAEWSGDALALYGRVRELAGAPFMGFVALAGVDLVSASPELFLRRRANRLETRPIKGTRPRGKTPSQDRERARQLEASDKDRAENVMIVDLARNDLGRVSDYGTVTVDRLAGIETHAGVHHLVSTVSSHLVAGTGLTEVVGATFPPGSVTGAPKIRAMEIIDELEPVRRGPYCGSVVWIEPNGDFDMSVSIRTMIATQGKLDLHVGGAVVADSDPHAEWRESMYKAARLLEAAGGVVVASGERAMAV